MENPEQRSSGAAIITVAMAATFLVRYGELALKSPPVRREFERTLERNILERFRLAQLPCRIRSDHGHLYVVCEEAANALQLLRTVFGVTSVSRVEEVPSEVGVIEAELLKLAGPALVPGSRFAVRTRRVGSHPFSSQELARSLGAAVLRTFPDRDLTVDLTHPTVELQVEVRGPRTYLSLDRSSGPGGLPLGVAGSLVALVADERGALGAYLMMKRGCSTSLVVEGAGTRLAEEVLRRFSPTVRLESPVPTAEEALGRLADAVRADGVVLPLTVEEYPEARARWGDRVLFSPTVGFSDAEVGLRWDEVRRLAS
ncbi:MAG: THUMP domain-containing protein [Thermoplasmata archaeon]|nr:THUMP domain-containing protein [Thermoplasmata archaeon]